MIDFPSFRKDQQILWIRVTCIIYIFLTLSDVINTIHKIYEQKDGKWQKYALRSLQ